MKLIFKTSIYFLISAIIVFIVGSFIFYNLVIIEINREIDEVLTFNKEKILEHIVSDNSLPNFNNSYDIKVIHTPVSKILKSHEIRDTLLFNEIKNKNVSYRVLVFTCIVDKLIYKIQLFKSFFEIEDLIKGILTFIILLILFLIFALFLVNIYISRITLKPFHSILLKLKLFDITKNKPLEIGKTSTSEFIQLRKEILAMTEKARNDYVQQKEFIENASHEIQTPLAVIKMKCEILLQSEENNEQQIKSYNAISESANRLSKLNNALLLITKIENKQFQTNEQINLQQVIEKNLLNFEELISLKNIKLNTTFLQSPNLQMNLVLADILISNLLNNAIKHNIEGGRIIINLSKQELLISNTGIELFINPETMFQRFFKEKSNSGSLGLGLTIVKKIIDLYNMEISYIFKDHLHILKIKFI